MVEDAWARWPVRKAVQTLQLIMDCPKLVNCQKSEYDERMLKVLKTSIPY